MKPLLKAPAAAKLLGVGRTKFWELVALYRVPRVQLDKRCVRFKEEDIEAFAQSRRISSAADDRRQHDGRRSAG